MRLIEYRSGPGVSFDENRWCALLCCRAWMLIEAMHSQKNLIDDESCNGMLLGVQV